MLGRRGFGRVGLDRPGERSRRHHRTLRSVTSGTSETPPVCSTSAWISRMRWRTSDDRAPGSATMKFACFLETKAPPSRFPLPPAASISRAAWSSSGFGEDAPAVRLGERLGRRRHARASSIRSRIGSDRPRVSRTIGARDDGVVRQARSPVREPRVRRVDRLGATIAQTGTSGCAPRRRPSRRRARPHSSGPTHRAWRGSRHRTPARPDRDGARPRRAREAASTPPAVSRSPSRAAHRYPWPSRSTSPGNPSSETRMFEPFPITTNGTSVATIASPTAAEISVGLRLQIERRGPAEAERRERRERERGADPVARRRSKDALGVCQRVVHDASRIRSSVASPSIHTSPQPIVMTRSPARTSSPRNSHARPTVRQVDHPRRRRHLGDPSTTSFP